jgi:molecular chaperone DnaK
VFEMTGIAPGPPGKAQIKVTFDLDENGVLTVTGEDKESGQVQQARTQTMDK